MSIHDEFSFINKIIPKKYSQPFLVTGIGDDAALFSGNSEVEEIVCMDTMIEGVHFTRKTMAPFHIGYKALASNISDIAAMGGTPTFYLVSIAIPKTWSESELLEIYEGIRSLAETYKMDLIGGDTVSSTNSLVVTITVLGRIAKGKKLLRQNAKPNDIVFVTGNLGEAAAGLELLLKNGYQFNFSKDEAYLVRRHQMPEPRVGVGKILAVYPRVALNDVSDGIASELNEIAAASKVTIEIDGALLPRSEYFRKAAKDQQLQWILYGGEDYELVGTVSADLWDKIRSECEEKHYKITKIGVVKAGEPTVYIKDGNQVTILRKQGYNHFR